MISLDALQCVDKAYYYYSIYQFVFYIYISVVMTGLSCVSTIAGMVYCCKKRWAASSQEPAGVFRLRRPVPPPLRPWQRTPRRHPSVELFVDETFKNPLAAQNSSSSDEENFHESVEMEEVVTV